MLRVPALVVYPGGPDTQLAKASKKSLTRKCSNQRLTNEGLPPRQPRRPAGRPLVVLKGGGAQRAAAFNADPTGTFVPTHDSRDAWRFLCLADRLLFLCPGIASGTESRFSLLGDPMEGARYTRSRFPARLAQCAGSRCHGHVLVPDESGCWKLGLLRVLRVVIISQPRCQSFDDERAAHRNSQVWARVFWLDRAKLL